MVQNLHFCPHVHKYHIVRVVSSAIHDAQILRPRPHTAFHFVIRASQQQVVCSTSICSAGVCYCQRQRERTSPTDIQGCPREELGICEGSAMTSSLAKSVSARFYHARISRLPYKDIEKPTVLARSGENNMRLLLLKYDAVMGYWRRSDSSSWSWPSQSPYTIWLRDQSTTEC